MKKFLVCFNVLVASTAMVSAVDESSPAISIIISAADQTITVANKPLAIQPTAHRKFKPSTLFQGLASTCAQAANVSAAQTQEEKQQATCNLLASIFQAAANVSKEEEKHDQKKATPLTDGNTTEGIVDLVISVTTLIKAEEREALVADLPTMFYLTVIPADDKQRALVTEMLANKDSAPVLVNQLATVLERIIAVETPALLDNFARTLLNSLA